MHVRTQAVVNERVDYKTLHAEMIAVLESQVWGALWEWSARLLPACTSAAAYRLLLASAAARLCNCCCPHPALLVLCLLCVQDKKSTLLEASLMEKDAQLEAVQSQLQASPAARSACPGCKPTALHLLRLLGCAPLGWAATSWMPASPK
jgi:hypothetical protein